jgi:predicted nucleic acid-binding protein
MPDRLAVVDASAVAAILFGGPRGEEVSRRLADTPLVAPTLLRYEVASVCRKKIDLHPEKRERLLRALSFLDEMDLRELDVSHEDVVALASEVGLSTYDASYLWLARRLNAQLVTLDDTLLRAFKRRGRKRT